MGWGTRVTARTDGSGKQIAAGDMINGTHLKTVPWRDCVLSNVWASPEGAPMRVHDRPSKVGDVGAHIDQKGFSLLFSYLTNDLGLLATHPCEYSRHGKFAEVKVRIKRAYGGEVLALRSDGKKIWQRVESRS